MLYDEPLSEDKSFNTVSIWRCLEMAGVWLMASVLQSLGEVWNGWCVTDGVSAAVSGWSLKWLVCDWWRQCCSFWVKSEMAGVWLMASVLQSLGEVWNGWCVTDGVSAAVSGWSLKWLVCDWWRQCCSLWVKSEMAGVWLMASVLQFLSEVWNGWCVTDGVSAAVSGWSLKWLVCDWWRQCCSLWVKSEMAGVWLMASVLQSLGEVWNGWCVTDGVSAAVSVWSLKWLVCDWWRQCCSLWVKSEMAGVWLMASVLQSLSEVWNGWSVTDGVSAAVSEWSLKWLVCDWWRQWCSLWVKSEMAGVWLMASVLQSLGEVWNGWCVTDGVSAAVSGWSLKWLVCDWWRQCCSLCVKSEMAGVWLMASVLQSMCEVWNGWCVTDGVSAAVSGWSLKWLVCDWRQCCSLCVKSEMAGVWLMASVLQSLGEVWNGWCVTDGVSAAVYVWSLKWLMCDWWRQCCSLWVKSVGHVWLPLDTLLGSFVLSSTLSSSFSSSYPPSSHPPSLSCFFSCSFPFLIPFLLILTLLIQN